jgi:hypothetical protein
MSPPSIFGTFDRFSYNSFNSWPINAKLELLGSSYQYTQVCQFTFWKGWSVTALYNERLDDISLNLAHMIVLAISRSIYNQTLWYFVAATVLYSPIHVPIFRISGPVLIGLWNFRFMKDRRPDRGHGPWSVLTFSGLLRFRSGLVAVFLWSEDRTSKHYLRCTR